MRELYESRFAGAAGVGSATLASDRRGSGRPCRKPHAGRRPPLSDAEGAVANPEPVQTETPAVNGRRSRLDSRKARLEKREQIIQEQRAARKRAAWLPWA